MKRLGPKRCPGSQRPGEKAGPRALGYPRVICPVCGRIVTVQASYDMDDQRATTHRELVDA